MPRAGSISFASEQAVGAAKPAVQQDRVRVGRVRTRDGQDVVLGIVADGEGGAGAGEAAERALRAVVEQVTAARAGELNLALRRGLESTAAAVRQSAAAQGSEHQVAATAVAVSRRRLFLAHAGHTSAHLIRDGRAVPLTNPNAQLLGSSASPNIETKGRDGVDLKPGDAIVLLSDGLTRPSLEDGRPFLDPADIPRHLAGHSTDEAARVLVSLALGRDAYDNVSVALVQLAGRLKPRRSFALPILALFLLGAGVIGLAVLVRGLLPEEMPPPATDYGFAVIVEGRARAEGLPGSEGPTDLGPLALVPATARLTALADLRLTFQSSYPGADGVEQISLYLAGGSRTQLTSVDPRQDPDGTGQAPAEGASLRLDSGRMLVSRTAGTWAATALFGEGSAAPQGSGESTLGVSMDVGSIRVDCLRGGCRVRWGAQSVALAQGQRLTIAGGNLGQASDIPASDLGAWNALCAGCLEGAGP
jgi:serine/threonine protein phosphatase PrpC